MRRRRSCPARRCATRQPAAGTMSIEDHADVVVTCMDSICADGFDP
ncbi:hypothetical protein [Dokdonella ginsengisoli]|uniref:Uncharacterized protein n=1 Tax=Dokdonella ginsengisoli TaxID=363846 RepID=A0ABV9QVI6_9GAMM